MKKYSLIGLAAIFIFFACNSKPSASDTTDLASISNTTTTPFTDTVKLDTFKVSLQGTTSDGNALIFKIISFQGKLVFQTKIETDEFIKDNVKLKTERDKMEFLKSQVKYFFEDEHILWPAVMPNEQADTNVPDTAFHNELKKTQLNGFNYHIDRESKIYIAWSEKEQKVKVYFKLTKS